MKLMMLLGGLVGFAIGTGFSWAQRSPWPSVVGRAAIATLLAGLLLRWWGRLWIKCLAQSHQERQAALRQKRADATPTNPAKK